MPKLLIFYSFNFLKRPFLVSSVAKCAIFSIQNNEFLTKLRRLISVESIRLTNNFITSKQNHRSIWFLLVKAPSTWHPAKWRYLFSSPKTESKKEKRIPPIKVAHIRSRRRRKRINIARHAAFDSDDFCLHPVIIDVDATSQDPGEDVPEIHGLLCLVCGLHFSIWWWFWRWNVGVVVVIAPSVTTHAGRGTKSDGWNYLFGRWPVLSLAKFGDCQKRGQDGVGQRARDLTLWNFVLMDCY